MNEGLPGAYEIRNKVISEVNYGLMKLATVMVIKPRIEWTVFCLPRGWVEILSLSGRASTHSLCRTHFEPLIPLCPSLLDNNNSCTTGTTRHAAKSCWGSGAGSIVVMTCLDLSWSTRFHLIWARLCIFQPNGYLQPRHLIDDSAVEPQSALYPVCLQCIEEKWLEIDGFICQAFWATTFISQGHHSFPNSHCLEKIQIWKQCIS